MLFVKKLNQVGFSSFQVVMIATIILFSQEAR